MARIEIGVGALLAGLATFGFSDDVAIRVILLLSGLLLVAQGTWDEFLRPWLLLEQRLTRWFLQRGWKVDSDAGAKHRGFHFWLSAEDPDTLDRVGISRAKVKPQLLTFTATVPLREHWADGLRALSEAERSRLLQDIHVLLAVKNMGFSGVTWPLDGLTVQTGQPVGRILSEHLLDVTAKEVGHTVVGVRSLIRRALAGSPGYSED